jgi:DHA2 family lincomycin resistance protein-like MFS transporter
MPSLSDGEQLPREPGRERTLGARESLVIWLLLISAFVVILNETVMGVALPKLMHELGITAAAGQWLTAAFLLTMSIVIPITGTLIQRISTRTLFLTAMSLFSAGTLLAGASPNFELLLVGRVIQACGTAIMMPLLMTTVTTAVPKHQRGAIMGRVAVVISVAPALGPTLSGVVLQFLSWRWLFFIVLPIALIVLVLGALRMPNVGERRKAPLDPLSVLLTVLGFGGLVYGLSAIGEQAGGQASVPPWIPIAVGAVGLALFVWRQLALQREDRALLDLRTFRTRQFALGSLMFGVFSMALFGSLILLPIYVQDVLGYDTLVSGLMLLPGGLAMALLGQAVGRRVDRRGARPVLIPGVIITALAMWGMTLFTDTTPLWQVVVIHVVLSIGLANSFTPLFEVSLGSLPSRLASHGSAIVSTVQQVAGAAGTALFVTLMTLGAVAVAGSPEAVDPHALAAGTRVAFIVGAATATLAVVVAFFIRDPIEQVETV